MASTIKITAIIDEVNRMNRESTCHPEGRAALNSFLEGILMANNVYAGHNNLTQEQVPAGELPGMILNREDPSKNQFPDDTRRVYYTHRKLTARKAQI